MTVFPNTSAQRRVKSSAADLEVFISPVLDPAAKSKEEIVARAISCEKEPRLCFPMPLEVEEVRRFTYYVSLIREKADDT